MPVFKLKKHTMTRLEKEFLRFQNARKIIHENIINYVADYRQFNGNSKDRKEFLEHEYFPRTPNLNSLIFGENENFLWHVEDIVILTGLSQPSISRILANMQISPLWSSRLLLLQVEVKSANNNSIFAYHEEIFDLIIDYQEAKCLERFLKPRYGEAPDSQEILRYWEYLKAKYESNELAIIGGNEELNEVPDIQAMKVKDILVLMCRKIFSAKNLTLSTIIFAVSFEIVRRFNFLLPVLAAVSFLIFFASVLLLKFRRGSTRIILEAGAVAMFSMFIWGLGLLSNGTIYSPSGTVLNINEEHLITLEPRLERGHKLIFCINSDFYDDLKEIFYRTSPDRDFISTGFNDIKYPLLLIEPENQHGLLNIELKYNDTKNKEHGPFKFSFNMDKTRFDASKDFIFNQTLWLVVKNSFGKPSIVFNINGANYADDVVDTIIYGINTKNPDRRIKITPEKTRIEIDISSTKNFENVSAYLIFKDGTASAIKTEFLKNKK